MADPERAAGVRSEERQRLRDGLLDQLQHLVREVDMLEGAIGRVPEKLLAEAPPSEAHSIKEIFALIARLDEAVHPERVERLTTEEVPRFAPADPEALLKGEAWNEQPITAIFERVRTARQALIERLEAVVPKDWLQTAAFPKREAGEGPPGQAEAFEERDLYEAVHAICQHDTARLRAMTHRLHESHMGAPPEQGTQQPA